MRKILVIILPIVLLSSCVSRWSYSGLGAPQYWGKIKERYKLCNIGYNQSPIDIKSKDKAYVFEKQGLTFFYSISGFTTQQDAHSINFYFDRKNYIQWRAKPYYLQKIAFHHPSEHRIDNEQHVLEMQIFHKSDSEQMMVLALFIDIGQENPEINHLITLLENKKQVDMWDDTDLSKVVKEDDFFFYDGSLTTPPCSEGVKWFVAKHAFEISKEQANKIIKLSLRSKSNARNVQEFHPELY